MANIVRRAENERGIARREGRDPFRSVADLMRFPFEDLFERPLLGLRQVFVPEVDLREAKDAYLLEADLPGFRQEDIEITVTGDRLTITGRREPPKEEERSYLLRERADGEFVRAFMLPSGADPNGVRADMKDGVLFVTIPKRPEVQARKISLGQQAPQPPQAGKPGNA